MWIEQKTNFRFIENDLYFATEFVGLQWMIIQIFEKLSRKFLYVYKKIEYFTGLLKLIYHFLFSVAESTL